MQVRLGQPGADTGVSDSEKRNQALGIKADGAARLSSSPTVFTVFEVAKILRLGKISVYQAIEKGEIPCVRIGRRILIPCHALEQLLKNVSSATKPAA